MTAAVSSAELESQLVNADPAKIAQDPAGFGALVKNYVNTAVADGVHNQVQQEVQAGLADFAREQAKIDGSRPNLAASVGRPANKFYNPKAPGAVLDGKFDGMGDLFAALRDERAGHQGAVTRLGELRNAFSTTTPSEGGFLVPEEYRSELQRIALEKGLVRSAGARVIPMAQPRISWPVLDSTSNVSNVHGGIVGYWTEEGAQLTASSATFARITLDTHKLTGYTEIPNELLSDSSISVGALVDEIFPEGLAWFEDLAFIDGTGVGQPLGFLKSPATVVVNKESGQAADTLVWANIVKMYTRMLPGSLSKAVWLMNSQLREQLLQMTLPVKNVAGTENVGGSAVGIYNDGTGAPGFTLLGHRVIFSEKLPAIGDLGDVNFVDLSYYGIGDRQQVSAMTSEHVKFQYDTTAYRIIQRVDGRPLILSAITPNKGSATLSPFVKLEAR